MRVLSDDDVNAVLDLPALLPVIADAFRADAAGEVERPERHHVPLGRGLDVDRRTGTDSRSDADPSATTDPLGTGLVMPAYVHGSPYFVVKLASFHPGNQARNLPTVNATIALVAADTGLPVGYAAGTRITNARTGCVGGLAARELAVEGPLSVGVIGGGAQARWQARSIAAAAAVEEVRVYSPSDSREACAADLRDRGIDARAVATPGRAVEGAAVVVTATTATEPVFDGGALAPGALVVAVGAYEESMRELDRTTVERADRLFADVPAGAAETGDFPDRGPADLSPFSSVLAGNAGREDDREVIVVKSVGTAVLDAAAAAFLFDRAVDADVGTVVDL
ncbi:MAG: ornithine cyclodeaminase family protein [Haloferacaceae archaeon]